jgi:hypothetical protein
MSGGTWVNDDFSENLGLITTIRPLEKVVWHILYFKNPPPKSLRLIELCMN